MEKKISDKEYKKIVELVPILCVDIILRHNNKYVLVKRNNEPLKGFHWVIGGRLLKDESLWEGAMRKVREEVGVGVHELKPVGFYEDSYSRSAFGIPTHTDSIVFEAETDESNFKVDTQSDSVILSDTLPERFIHKLWRFTNN